MINRTPTMKTRSCSQKESKQNEPNSKNKDNHSLDKTFVMEDLINLDEEEDSGMKTITMKEIKKLSLDEKIELILNKCLDVMSVNRKLQCSLVKYEKTVGDLVRDVGILHEENHSLKEQISKFSSHTDYDMKYERLKQRMKNDEIEIWGIEEHANEDITTVVIDVAKNFNVDLEPNDMIFANRRKLNNKAGHDIPRTIKVKFYNRLKRDKLIQAGKSIRLPRNENIDGNNGRNFVYINEALTKHMEYIYGKTRELKRKNKINKTWCKNGRIFVQRGNQPSKLIETIIDLNDYI